jgi:membrane protein YdbS with pleckstrin-like domain
MSGSNENPVQSKQRSIISSQAANASVSRNAPENGPRVELRKMYPLSSCLILKQVFPWVLLLSGIALFFWWSMSADDPFPHAGLLGQDLSYEFDVIICVGFLILLLKILYAALYIWSYDYYVERGRLFIRKGVVLKHTGICLLSHIADVYLVRSLTDLIFGLHVVMIGTAADRSEQFGFIEGLSDENARRVQQHLLNLVESSHDRR